MITPFQILQDEWIQIAPLGDHPHEKGIQRIDCECVASMANQFNSISSKIGRMFAGVPMFEGHHDSDPERYPNGRSFAWVRELQDRAGDGLWARLRWTVQGRDLVRNGNYKFVSPLWTARPVGEENGRKVFRPEMLLSLALTNLPNLSLPPLANSKSYMKTLTEILGLNEDAAAEQICSAAETLANARLNLQKNAEALANDLAAERKKVEEERAARIELILANAIVAGRLTLAEKDRWRGELQRDLVTAERTLAGATLVLNQVSQTEGLGNEKAAYDTEATRRIFLNAFMVEKMENGMSHLAAWELAKTMHSQIFEKMKKPVLS
jgi:hypothetical protein